MDELSDNKSVLNKVASILDAFGQPPHKFTFTDVYEQTDISKASIHRLMGQLVDAGFLEKSGTGKTYQLGRRLNRLLHFNASGALLEPMFNTELQSVADALGEAAFAARLSGNEVELFEVCGPSAKNSSYLHPGLGIRPIHACSSAKCILAYQDEEEITRLLETNLAKIATTAKRTKKDLQSELLEIRRVGFAVCDEELEEAVYSIAFPIMLQEAGVMYSIGIAAPKSRISDATLTVVRDRLSLAASQIGSLLGTSVEPVAAPQD